MTTDPIVLLVPFGAKRARRLELPREVAHWLMGQLSEALGGPRLKPRRRPKLRRGRWQREAAP
jgi:hypothetical protein